MTVPSLQELLCEIMDHGVDLNIKTTLRVVLILVVAFKLDELFFPPNP